MIGMTDGVINRRRKGLNKTKKNSMNPPRRNEGNWRMEPLHHTRQIMILSAESEKRKQAQEDDERQKDKNRKKEETAARLEQERRDLSDIRLKSRQDYLRKREVEKIILLRQQVEEEAQEERTNPHLTQRELAEFPEEQGDSNHCRSQP